MLFLLVFKILSIAHNIMINILYQSPSKTKCKRVDTVRGKIPYIVNIVMLFATIYLKL